MDNGKLAKFLTDKGYEIAKSTLHKLGFQGEGPPSRAGETITPTPFSTRPWPFLEAAEKYGKLVQPSGARRPRRGRARSIYPSRPVRLVVPNAAGGTP